MSGIWIYKPDGSVQCHPDLGSTIGLEEMREGLTSLIGDDNIIDQEKRNFPGIHIDLCGSPTGAVNAYRITAMGLWTILFGFRGSEGWRFWPEISLTQEDVAKHMSSGDSWVPFPWSAGKTPQEAEGIEPMSLRPIADVPRAPMDAFEEQPQDLTPYVNALNLSP